MAIIKFAGKTRANDSKANGFAAGVGRCHFFYCVKKFIVRDRASQLYKKAPSSAGRHHIIKEEEKSLLNIKTYYKNSLKKMSLSRIFSCVAFVICCLGQIAMTNENDGEEIKLEIIVAGHLEKTAWGSVRFSIVVPLETKSSTFTEPNWITEEQIDDLPLEDKIRKM